MARSVSYLSKAEKVSYFSWPYYEDEDGNFQDYEDTVFVIENIRETIIEKFSGFSPSRGYDGRETSIILEGYGTEIGLSEYCGLASLSIRIAEDWQRDEEEEAIRDWIVKNWPAISSNWSEYRKLGSFSNGEGVFEKIN